MCTQGPVPRVPGPFSNAKYRFGVALQKCTTPVNSLYKVQGLIVLMYALNTNFIKMLCTKRPKIVPNCANTRGWYKPKRRKKVHFYCPRRPRMLLASPSAHA